MLVTIGAASDLSNLDALRFLGLSVQVTALDMHLHFVRSRFPRILALSGGLEGCTLRMSRACPSRSGSTPHKSETVTGSVE